MTFYSATDFHNLSSPVQAPSDHYMALTLASMCTAAAAKTLTSTTSLSGITGDAAERLCADLRGLGYGCDIITTPGSIIVSW